jgi:hypothetical protein
LGGRFGYSFLIEAIGCGARRDVIICPIKIGTTITINPIMMGCFFFI